jgi:hypothetical protein
VRNAPTFFRKIAEQNKNIFLKVIYPMENAGVLHTAKSDKACLLFPSHAWQRQIFVLCQTELPEKFLRKRPRIARSSKSRQTVMSSGPILLATSAIAFAGSI